MFFIVLCYIYAGPDPGIDPDYTPSYQVRTFEKKEDAENFLFRHHNQSCQVYQGKKIEFEMEMTEVKTDKVVGVKIKP